MADFEPNLILDEYAFLTELELGGWSKFSRGFRARDAQGNYYILELIPKKRRGMDLLLSLRQKTILNCFDIKQADNGSWIQIFEYFPGQTLRDLIDGGEEFSLLDIAIICIQICNGLSSIHELKLIHEDLRPENILINSQGELKIKGILIPEVMVNYSNIPEIWNYVAPEQVSKSVWVTPGASANAYSLASILYELLTKRKYGKSIREIHEGIKGAKDPLLSLRTQLESFPGPRLMQGLPEEFAVIISRSLLVDSDTRLDIKGINDILTSFINKSLSDGQSEDESSEGTLREEAGEEGISEGTLREEAVEEEISEGTLREEAGEAESSEEHFREKISEEEISEETPREEEREYEPSEETSDRYYRSDEEGGMVSEEQDDNLVLQEFIPSIPRDFFSEGTYEKEGTYKDTVTEVPGEERSFQMPSKEIAALSQVVDYIEHRIESDHIKQISGKLDYVTQELKYFKNNTFQIINGLKKIIDKEEDNFKDTLIANETVRVKNSLSRLFSMLDLLADKSFYDDWPSTKELLDDSVEQDRSRTISENTIMNLMTINNSLERALAVLSDFRLKLEEKEHLTEEHIKERFLENLYMLLKQQYDIEGFNIKNVRDLEKVLYDKSEFFKAIDSLRSFNFLLKHR
ncbi:MAG: protein kinase [Candidatus Eremiobacterota bacterium]